MRYVNIILIMSASCLGFTEDLRYALYSKLQVDTRCAMA